MRGVRRAVVLAILLIGLLTGCASGSGGSDPSIATGGAVSGADDGATAGGGPGGIAGLKSVVAGATAAAGSGTPSDAASPAASSPAATRTVADGELFFFTTPSKNIGCELSADQARCDIRVHDWAAPGRPASCELDYGQGVYVADGPADYVCAGDTVLGEPNAVELGYGQAVQAGAIACTSTKAGVSCRNTATGRGFALSRQAFAPF